MKQENLQSEWSRTSTFDQPVVLQQTSRWSRGILWSLISVSIFTVGWAVFAQIKQAIPASGKLEDQVHPYDRFPVQVRLHNQSIRVNGQDLPLRSGMSVTANIIAEHDRSVLNIFLDQFINKIDSVKTVR